MSSAVSMYSAGSKGVVFKAIIRLLCQFLGLCDVACLVIFVAAYQKEDERVASPNVIDSITRPESQSQLLDILTDRFRVSGIARGETLQSVSNPESRASIPQIAKPLFKLKCLADFDTLSFIKDIWDFVNWLIHGAIFLLGEACRLNVPHVTAVSHHRNVEFQPQWTGLPPPRFPARRAARATRAAISGPTRSGQSPKRYARRFRRSRDAGRDPRDDRVSPRRGNAG